MTTHSVRHLITKSGITFVLALSLAPGSELAAQQRTTSQDCQTRIDTFVRSRGLAVDNTTRARAIRSCMAGDMNGVVSILKGESTPSSPQTSRNAQEQDCLRSLDAYIQKHGLQPESTVVAQARRRCATGDVRAAIELVRPPSQPPQTPDVGQREAACAKRIDSYIATNRLEVDPRLRASAIAQCTAGNMERARALLDNPPSRRPSEPQATPADLCLRDLAVYIKRAALVPDERTYAAARAKCNETGDARSAIDVLRAGTQQPPRPAPPLTEADCLERLDAFIKRSGINTNANTLATARSHCSTGDLRRAIETVRGGGGRLPSR